MPSASASAIWRQGALPSSSSSLGRWRPQLWRRWRRRRRQPELQPAAAGDGVRAPHYRPEMLASTKHCHRARSKVMSRALFMAGCRAAWGRELALVLQTVCRVQLVVMNSPGASTLLSRCTRDRRRASDPRCSTRTTRCRREHGGALLGRATVATTSTASRSSRSSD